MLSDDPTEKLNFGFETTGENNDFALGLMYDFSGGIANGKMRINAKTSLIFQELHDFDFNLALNQVDAEYSGNFQFNMNGNEYVSVETKYKLGFASALLKTPVPDYETILLQIESDFETKATLLFELNGVPTSVTAATDSQEHFKVIIKTPAVGWETVTANYDVLPDGSRRLLIDRSGTMLTTLLVKTDLKPAGGMIDIDWKATSNIWAKLKAEYENGKGMIHLQTASDKLKKLKVEFDIQQGDPKSNYALILDFNEHHLDYQSYSIINPGVWEGWSELNTNIALLGAGKRVTTYKLQFSQDLSTPFAVAYKILQDGEIDIDINVSLDIQLTKGFDLKIYFHMPKLHQEPFDIKAKLDAEVAGAQKSLKFVASYSDGSNNYNLSVEARVTDKEVTFIAKTNFGKPTEVKGKFGWASEQNRTKINFFLMLNTAKLLQGPML